MRSARGGPSTASAMPRHAWWQVGGHSGWAEQRSTMSAAPVGLMSRSISTGAPVSGQWTVVRRTNRGRLDRQRYASSLPTYGPMVAMLLTPARSVPTSRWSDPVCLRDCGCPAFRHPGRMSASGLQQRDDVGHRVLVVPITMPDRGRTRSPPRSSRSCQRPSHVAEPA